MKLTEIKALIELAKSTGIKEINVDGCHIVLHPPEQVGFSEFDARHLIDPVVSKDNKDEVMFWAVGGPGHIGTNGQPTAPPLVGEQDAD